MDPKQIKDKFDYTDCPLCGSYKRLELGSSSIRSFWDNRIIVPDNITNIVKCKNCDFIYANPRTNETWFLDFPNEYGYKMQLKFEHWHRKILNVVKEKTKSGGNLLDIGCAGGRFVELAKSHGFNSFGFDIDEKFVKYGRDILKLNLKAGKLDDAGYTENFFDVVTLIEVLEHVRDPRQILKSGIKLLKRGGKLFLTVPNFELFYLLNFKLFKTKKDFYFLYPAEHISFWRQSVLIKTLKKEGFKNIEVYFLPGFYDNEKTSKFNRIKNNVFDMVRKAIFYLSCKKINFTAHLFIKAEK